MTARIGVIVVSYRTGPALRDCLAAVLAEPDVGAACVVDNGNCAEVEAWLDGLAAGEPRLRILRPGENLGFGRACNLGARAVTTDTLVFLNPDAHPLPGALARLAAHLDAAPAGALVGGRVLDPEGAEQQGSRRGELTLASALGAMTGRDRLHLHEAPLPAGLTPVAAVSGAFFAMRRDAFLALGGFDEGYFLHVEDLDLCRRVRLSGAPVLFAPDAAATHAGATSAASRWVIAWHKAAGFVRYFWKFAATPLDRTAAAVAAPFIVIAILTRTAISHATRASLLN